MRFRSEPDSLDPGYLRLCIGTSTRRESSGNNFQDIMANNLAEPQKLTPSEVTRIFSGMSPLRATRYFNKIMTNPNTPKQNLEMVMQYRQQNESKFLSDDQMRSQVNKGSWSFGKGFSGGYRRKGLVYDSDGFAYDNYGNRYDIYGNNTGDYQDGGSGYRFQGNGNPNGYSKGFGLKFTGNPRRPAAEPRGSDEISQILGGMKGNVNRTRYVNKVLNNPDTNPQTAKNIMLYYEANPDQFVPFDQIGSGSGGFFQRRNRGFNNGYSNGYSSGYRDGYGQYPPKENRSFWNSLWKSPEQMQAMTPKKRKFFVGSFYRKDCAKNTAYALRVMTNPTTSVEDKQAMCDVVNEEPGMFFKKAQVPAGGRNRNC